MGRLKQVKYVPGLTHDLLSISKMVDAGWECAFRPGDICEQCILTHLATGETLRGIRINNLFVLPKSAILITPQLGEVMKKKARWSSGIFASGTSPTPRFCYAFRRNFSKVYLI